MPTTKDVFWIIALALIKGLPQRVSISLFVLILIKGLPQRIFYLYSCPNPKHRPTKNHVFLYFCQNINQMHTTKGVSLLLTEP